MPTKRAQSVLGLLLVAVIWGAATPVIKFTLQGIDPVPFLTYRFFLSSLLAVAIILFYLQKKHLIRENFLQIIIYSLFSTTFALGLLFLGMDRTSVLDTVLITAVSPLVTAFFGVVFFKDVITKQEKLGILLAFIGTVITILEPVLTGQAKISQLSGN